MCRLCRYRNTLLDVHERSDGAWGLGSGCLISLHPEPAQEEEEKERREQNKEKYQRPQGPEPSGIDCAQGAKQAF